MANKDISKLISDILRKKEVKIESFDDVEYYKRDFRIDTGNKALNFIVSGDCNKGLLAGQMVSLEGKSYTGKTLTALHIIAGAVKSGAYTILADIERSYKESDFTQFGIKSSDVNMLENSQQLEDFFQSTYEILQTVPKKFPETPIVIVVDSLSALVTRHLQEVGMDKVDMQKAKQISSGLNLIQSCMSRYPNVFFVMVNQTYDSMDPNKYATNEQKEVTKGGGGIPYYSGIRIRYSVAKRVYRDKIGTKDDKKSPVVGAWIRLESIKNRFSAPYIKAELLDLFGEGFDAYSGLFTMAHNHKLIDQTKSGWYNFIKNPISVDFRKSAFEKMCKDDHRILDRFSELNAELMSKRKDAMKSSDVEIPDSFDDVLDDEITPSIEMAEKLKKQNKTAVVEKIDTPLVITS